METLCVGLRIQSPPILQFSSNILALPCGTVPFYFFLSVCLMELEILL